MEWADFQSAASNMSHDLIERQLLHRIHVVAEVTSIGIRRVIIMSLPAILAWLALLAGDELARLLVQS